MGLGILVILRVGLCPLASNWWGRVCGRAKFSHVDLHVITRESNICIRSAFRCRWLTTPVDFIYEKFLMV